MDFEQLANRLTLFSLVGSLTEVPSYRGLIRLKTLDSWLIGSFYLIVGNKYVTVSADTEEALAEYRALT
jgi:hypothetical protein